MPYNFAMGASLDRAERSVEEQSVALKKPLGLGDLAPTDIVFVVGSSWVGTAAKLGTSHLLAARHLTLLSIPEAAVVIYLSRLMPLEGGIYQWAKLAFNEFTGFIVAWNSGSYRSWAVAMGRPSTTTSRRRRRSRLDARQSLVCLARQLWCQWPRGWTGVRGLSLGNGCTTSAASRCSAHGALIFPPFISLARGDLDTYQPLQIAAPAISLFYCFNIFSKLAVGGLAGFEYVGICGEAHRSRRATFDALSRSLLQSSRSCSFLGRVRCSPS